MSCSSLAWMAAVPAFATTNNYSRFLPAYLAGSIPLSSAESRFMRAFSTTKLPFALSLSVRLKSRDSLRQNIAFSVRQFCCQEQAQHGTTLSRRSFLQPNSVNTLRLSCAQAAILHTMLVHIVKRRSELSLTIRLLIT